MHIVNFYSGKLHWNHPVLLQEKGGAWSAVILEDRIECMDVQEEVGGQNVNSHKFIPNLLIWVICIFSGVYELLSGSVRFPVHKYVNRRVRRSQSKYVSEKKLQPAVIELGDHALVVTLLNRIIYSAQSTEFLIFDSF